MQAAAPCAQASATTPSRGLSTACGSSSGIRGRHAIVSTATVSKYSHNKPIWHTWQARWTCKPWAAGDVIGLAANVGLGKVAVSRNGDWCERGCGVVFSDRAIRGGVYPALSIQRHPLRYAFAADGFRHAPPPAEVWEEAKPSSGKVARGKKGKADGGSGGAAGAEEEEAEGALDDAGAEDGGDAARDGTEAPPVPIVDDGALRLWHKLDCSFRRPKARP